MRLNFKLIYFEMFIKYWICNFNIGTQVRKIIINRKIYKKLNQLTADHKV